MNSILRKIIAYQVVFSQLIVNCTSKTTTTTTIVQYNETLEYNDNLALQSGSLQVGTPNQSTDKDRYLYSTASPFTAIAAVNCTTCHSPVYNRSLSSSFQYSTFNQTTIKDFNTTLKGVVVQDKVCIDDGDLCVDSMNFFSVKKVKPSFLNQLDYAGILGLGPPSVLRPKANFFPQLDTMYEASPTVSWDLDFTMRKFSVCFGLCDMDVSNLSGVKTLSTLVEHTDVWAFNLVSIFYGSGDHGTSLDVSSTPIAFINTGTPFIQMSYDAYQTFAGIAQGNNFTCNFTQFGVGEFCYTDEQTCDQVVNLFDDIVFTLDGQTFKLLAADYMVSNFLGHNCSAMVTYDRDDNLSLGTAFFNGFFISTNFEKLEVNIAPRNPHKQENDYGLDAIAIIAIILCSIAFMLCLVCIIARCCSNTKKSKQRHDAEALIAADQQKINSEGSSGLDGSDNNITED